MLTKDNQLASIYQRAPQLVSEFMVQLLALNRGKSLESELAKYPTKQFDTDDEFSWQIIGSSRRNIPLVEARNIDGKFIQCEFLEIQELREPSMFTKWSLWEELLMVFLLNVCQQVNVSHMSMLPQRESLVEKQEIA